jgi:predicted YcjX-like family ATPase
VEFGQNLFDPTIRLGITGLSRAGKTVFITALVHGLVRGGRFPVFEASAQFALWSTSVAGRTPRARSANCA